MHARFVMASAALAALAGCAAPMATQDPAQRMAAIDSTRAGTAVLSCGNDLSCALRWQNVRQTALQDAAAQQWADLAALVIGAGYNADVSWYYLGQAAQGMGSYDAARQYFNTAIGDAAAGGPAACAGGVVDLCNGVAVANDAQMLLSQVPPDQAAAPPASRRRTVTHHTAPPSTASGSSPGFVPPVTAPPAGGSAAPFVPPVAAPAPAPAAPQAPAASPGFVAPVQ